MWGWILNCECQQGIVWGRYSAGPDRILPSRDLGLGPSPAHLHTCSLAFLQTCILASLYCTLVHICILAHAHLQTFILAYFLSCILVHMHLHAWIRVLEYVKVNHEQRAIVHLFQSVHQLSIPKFRYLDIQANFNVVMMIRPPPTSPGCPPISRLSDVRPGLGARWPNWPSLSSFRFLSSNSQPRSGHNVFKRQIVRLCVCVCVCVCVLSRP